MKRLLDLTLAVLRDCGTELGAENFERDILTLEKRVAGEGDSFLTISLPSYCQSFESALDRGYIVKADWPGWTKTARGTPRFLQGFLNGVFDADGVVLREASVHCIRSVRQVTLLHKKVWALASAARQEAAVKAFVSCEQEVFDAEPDFTFQQVASIIVSDLLANDKGGFSPDNIIGAHGPGATQDRQTGNSKWRFQTWTHRLEAVFPSAYHCWHTEEAAFSVYNGGTDGITPDGESRDINLLREDEEPPVRIVFVPKTMKTPRVIAIEPSWMQFVQQGLMRYLVPLIERSKYSGGRVNFSDQSVNQRLALSSSHTGHLATVDMKEASDRVSLSHVKAAFRVAPALLKALLVCRSTAAELPDGTVVNLRKFASMGSAVCFPVEALVFFIGVIAGRLAVSNTPATPSSVAKHAKNVYVFGDDLLFPSDEAPAVMQYLESLGFKCNARKSFWIGKFRESCGVDAYDGQDVTPVYCRRPLDRADTNAIVGWVAMANQFYHKGMWRTAQACRKAVEETLGRRLPFVRHTSAALGWHNFSNCATHSRWNRHLHRLEERAMVPTGVNRNDPLDGYSAMHKCLSGLQRRGDLPPAGSEKHLAVSVRPWSLELKTRWVPA